MLAQNCQSKSKCCFTQEKIMLRLFSDWSLSRNKCQDNKLPMDASLLLETKKQFFLSQKHFRTCKNVFKYRKIEKGSIYFSCLNIDFKFYLSHILSFITNYFGFNVAIWFVPQRILFLYHFIRPKIYIEMQMHFMAGDVFIFFKLWGKLQASRIKSNAGEETTKDNFISNAKQDISKRKMLKMFYYWYQRSID